MNKKILSLFLITLAVTNNAMPMTTPLHQAAQDGNVETLRTLLQQNLTDVNAQTGITKWTPLHNAIRYGNSTCTQILLRHGANVDTKDSLGQTPLHIAAQYGFKDCVEILLHHHANHEQKTKTDKTATTLARENGHTDLANFLEDWSADFIER